MLKPVDQAYLGSNTYMFKIVSTVKPDIISIGPDQIFDLDWLRRELEKRDLNVEVVKITDYHKAPLDSSCKIIRKIKETEFQEESLKNC